MANISEEKWIEMLEKKADGSYIAKYPKVKSKSGVTFDEHLAEIATQERHGLRVNSEGELEYFDGAEWKNGGYKSLSPFLLYEGGIENEAITGGWVNGAALGTGDQSKFTDFLHLDVYSNPTGVGGRSFVTDNIIDLTGCNTLFVEWENVGSAGTNNQTVLIVDYRKDGTISNFTARLRLTEGDFQRRIDQLDVSAINGGNYVRVHAYDGSTSADNPSTVNVFKIWGV